MLLPLFASAVFFSCSSLPPQGIPAEEFGMYQIAGNDDSRPEKRTLADAEISESNGDDIRWTSVSNATFVYHGISMDDFTSLCAAVDLACSENKDDIFAQFFSREPSSETKFGAIPANEDFKTYYDEEKALGCQQLLSRAGAEAFGDADLRSNLDEMNLSVESLPQLFFAANASREENEPFSLSGYYIKLEYRGHNRDLIRSSYGSIRIAIKLDARTPVDVGGFKATTSGTGSFYFSGEPSLSRIIDGIVLIVDENGNKVEVREKPETGKWCVHVAGRKDNAPYEFDFEIDALNK